VVSDSLPGVASIWDVVDIARSGAWVLALRDGPPLDAPTTCQGGGDGRRRLVRLDVVTGAETDLVRWDRVVDARLTANDERVLVALNVEPYCARVALQYRSLRPDGSDARPVAGPPSPAVSVGVALRP
jgi:hypothetical protein